MLSFIHSTRPLAAAFAAALATACGNGGNGESTPASTPQFAAMRSSTAEFEVTLVNLTPGQPLTPFVAIAHDDSFRIFAPGKPASVAIERLAEGGETAPLAAQCRQSPAVFDTAVADAAVAPVPNNKGMVRLTVPAERLPGLHFSLASMLGNTNDGFTGVTGQSLARLEVNGTLTMLLPSYDAGTESNTESADTVPGPATEQSGGKREPFNPARDDLIDSVQVHAGVISKDDGLRSSALTLAQRWDNPVALLSIKRVR